jgi:hypothetical protein
MALAWLCGVNATTAASDAGSHVRVPPRGMTVSRVRVRHGSHYGGGCHYHTPEADPGSSQAGSALALGSARAELLGLGCAGKHVTRREPGLTPLDPELVTGVWRGKPRAQSPTAPVTLRFVYLAFPANARRMARPARSDLADDAERSWSCDDAGSH